MDQGRVTPLVGGNEEEKPQMDLYGKLRTLIQGA